MMDASGHWACPKGGKVQLCTYQLFKEDELHVVYCYRMMEDTDRKEATCSFLLACTACTG